MCLLSCSAWNWDLLWLSSGGGGYVLCTRSELYIEDCVKRLHLLPCSLTREPDQDTNVLAHFSTQLRASQAKLHSSHLPMLSPSLHKPVFLQEAGSVMEGFTDQNKLA